MPTGPNSRRIRAPWPCEINISGQGFMLGKKDKDGELISTTLPGLSAAPQEFKYGASNPAIEQTFNFSDLSGGFGQRYVRGEGDERRYYWSDGVDASIQGILQLGPRVVDVVPSPDVDTTNGISDFWEAASAGTTKLFALNGRYALVRNGDLNTNWDISKDFGAGKIALDVIRVKQSGGANTYSLVAMGNADNFWSYDGTSDTTTWTQHATLKSQCWAVSSDENGTFLWRAFDTNYVAKCDLVADPLTAGNWTAGDPVGDATSAIVRMVVHPDGTLYIFKTDGIYVFLPNGLTKRLYSGMASSPSSENGRYNFVFENWIHTTFGGSHFRIAPGGFIEPIGPERAIENDSAARGYLTAGIGTPFGAYAGIKNPDTGNYYLAKFGSWVTGEDGGPHRIDAWHASLYGGAAGTIKAMRVTTVGAPTDHQRLYFGTKDGTIAYFVLPCHPNPASCSSYVYSVGDGHVLMSLWDGGFPLDNKHFHWAAVSLQRCNSGGSAQVNVGLNDVVTGAGAGYLSTYLGAHSFDTVPGERREFIADTAGTNIGVKVIIARSTDTTSPLVHGVGFAFSLRPLVSLVHEFSVIAEDGLLKLDGTRLGIGASKIESLIKAAVTTVGSVTCYLPDHNGVSMELAFVSYTKGVAWSDRAKRWMASLQITAVESAPLTENYGATSGVLGA